MVVVVRRPPFPARTPPLSSFLPYRPAVAPRQQVWKTWRAGGHSEARRGARPGGGVPDPSPRQSRAGRRTPRASRAPGYPQPYDLFPFRFGGFRFLADRFFFHAANRSSITATITS